MNKNTLKDLLEGCNRKINILLIAFFISGCSALIYQIIWVKELTLIFGSQTLAVSTILASFMGGLSLGSFIISRYANKITNVVKVYIILEIIIALYALIIPFIFIISDNLYQLIWTLISENYTIISLFRFVVTLIILIIPTSMMGATLPLLIKLYVKQDDTIIRYTSILYGVNTLGAVVGTFISGFYLIETVGINGTNYIAVSLNFIAALIASSLLFLDSESSIKNKLISTEIKIKTINLSGIEKLILLTMLISGFSSMVFEIIWSRQLVLIFGSTTYAYTSMLVIFLIGISVGSISINRLLIYSKQTIKSFAVFELLIGLLVIWGTFYYKDLFYLFNVLSRTLDSSLYVFNIILMALLIIFPPTFLLGIIFPLSIKIFTQESKEISERTGLIYSFNTLGCIMGSFSTGFILIPIIGLQNSIILGASLNILLAGLFFFISTENNKSKWVNILSSIIIVILIFVFPAKWEKQIISTSTYLNKSGNDKKTYNDYYQNLRNYNIVYYKEGQNTTISVVEWSLNNDKNYSLYSNGKIEASTYFKDMRNQSMISYLPLIIMNKPKKVLIIGMGSGITASVAASFPIKSLDVVELEKAILGASKFFSRYYGNPLSNKKIKFIEDDARNYLKVTNKKYDLIISEPSNVWVNGVASLFTIDMYKIIKKKLNQNGILCQWLQIYDLKPEVIKSVLMALKKEFKYVYICHSKTSEDFIFLASQKPIILDLNRIKRNINQNGKIKRDLLNRFNIRNEYEFLNLFLANNTQIEKNVIRWMNKIPVNSDDNSYLEFKAVKDFYSSKANYFQDVYPSKTFKAYKGLKIKDIKDPPEDFFKKVVIAIQNQYNDSSKLFDNKESFEMNLYREQILVYLKEYLYINKGDYNKFDFAGYIYLCFGNDLLGIKYLEKAAALNSKDPSTYKLLARYYNKLILEKTAKLDPDKALKYSLKAIELVPDNAYSYLLVGISYYNNHKYEEALKYINKYYSLSVKNHYGLVDEYYDYRNKLLLDLKEE
ncbi:MAG: fused MFS/spermidine synthase [Cyanobacteriota bacterium]